MQDSRVLHIDVSLAHVLVLFLPSVSAVEPVRRIEVWLDDATWGLMHEDGQLKVADISLINLR